MNILIRSLLNQSKSVSASKAATPIPSSAPMPSPAVARQAEKRYNSLVYLCLCFSRILGVFWRCLQVRNRSERFPHSIYISLCLQILTSVRSAEASPVQTAAVKPDAAQGISFGLFVWAQKG